jgi:hypothetical protein
MPCRILSFAAMLVLAACSTARQSEPGRTATEQLLFSVAVERAVDQLALDILPATKVFVDPAYVEGTDSKYLLSTIRNRVLKHGAALVDNKSQAETVVEPRIGAISVDRGKTLVGTPRLNIPVPLAGDVGFPQLAIYKSDTQQGVIKVAATSYDTRTGKLIQDLEPVYGFSHKTEQVVLFLFSWSANDLMPEPTREDWVGD